MKDGIILLDKPKGLSTAHCSRQIGKALAQKTGHTGTLDPMASGLIIVMVGRTTKAAPWLTGLDKEYEATIRLGQITNTADTEGKVIEEKPVNVDAERIEAFLESFQGRISQTPPAYSALKHKGKPLYKYARRGIAVDIKPRDIEIYDIEFIEFDSPLLKIRTRVSSGAYIRSLAVDIGQKAGCGAHLVELRRTEIGNFSIEDSIGFDDAIQKITADKTDEVLIALNDALSFYPTIEVGGEEAKQIAHGMRIQVDWPNVNSNVYRLVTRSFLIALVEKKVDGSYKFLRVFCRPEDIED